MIAAALLAAASLPLAAAFGPCCAFNGEGDAVLLGTGVLNAFAPASGSREPTGPAYAAPMAVGVSGAHQFTTILFGARTGPEDAVAGWVVTSNATNDVIFMFSNVTGTPQCAAGVGPKGSMVPEYGLCGGSGLFPQHDHDYKVAGLTVGVFVQQSQSGGASMRFADEAQCVPMALVADSTPFGTGAFSANFESGVPAAPPQSWSAPPSWCEGHWITSAQ